MAAVAESERRDSASNSDIAPIELRFGLPVDQRRRLPKVYRALDHDEITARFPWRISLSAPTITSNPRVRNPEADVRDRLKRVNKRPLPTPLGFRAECPQSGGAIRQQAANSGHSSRALNFLHSGRWNDLRGG